MPKNRGKRISVRFRDMNQEMPMINNRFFLIRGLVKTLLALGMLVAIAGAADSIQVRGYIEDIKAGPSVYYTPEASAYFAARGSQFISVAATNREAATRSFLAVLKLGGLPGGMSPAQYRDAVPVLLDYFPRAIHVVEISQAVFGRGEGTFDDCISTQVMNAKTQLLRSMPFLDYNALTLCEHCIDESHETSVISRQHGTAGEMVGAVYSLRIIFTFYAGECALSRIAGVDLGHDPLAWRLWWQSSTGNAVRAPVYAENPSLYRSASVYVPVAPVTRAISAPSLRDLLPGAEYRFLLTTGDGLSGSIESRNDSNITILTSQGKPFVVAYPLIQSWQSIAPPRQAVKSEPMPVSGSNPEMVAYDELKRRIVLSPMLEVRTENGSVLRGKLQSMTDDALTMEIEGRTNSVARSRITQISILPQPGSGQAR